MHVSRNRVPKCLWGFELVREVYIYSHSSGTDGRTGMEILTGDTSEISDWTDFEFYDMVWYWYGEDDG